MKYFVIFEETLDEIAEVPRIDPSKLRDAMHKPQKPPGMTPYNNFKDLKGWMMEVKEDRGGIHSVRSYEL